MSQNTVRSARRTGFLGVLALTGAAIALAPAALARGGHGGGGGGGHAGGGGASHGGGGGRGGGAPSGGARGGSGGGARSYSGGGRGYAGGARAGGGWVRHTGGTHYSPSSRYAAPGGTHGGAPGGTHGGATAYHGGGYHGGYGHGGHYHYWYGGWYRPWYPAYWGWGWGWGWGWAPYWSTWWWGGPWWGYGGPAVYVAPGNVEVGAYTGRYAIVKTDVTPEEAQVYLDDKYIGTADDFDGYPDFLYLGPGKYHVEFRLPNYLTYATDLDVARGQQIKIEEKLKLEPGKSALDSFPPESKGTPLGRVFTKSGAAAEAAPQGDDGWSNREAPPPSYRGIGDEGRTDAQVEPARPSNRGRIRFRVSPDDAAVYMDDRYLGAADDLAANPRGLVAEPGTHTITVARPGYKSKTIDVTARAGSAVDVVIDLEK